jgi:hypothetical protein
MISCGKGWQCFFPQYLLPHIKTPLYIVNGGYDWWQVDLLFTRSKVLFGSSFSGHTSVSVWQ